MRQAADRSTQRLGARALETLAAIWKQKMPLWFYWGDFAGDDGA
jgi:hypothetical protein